MTPNILINPSLQPNGLGLQPMRRPFLRNYQSVLILKPDLDEAQVEESINKITAILKKFGGSVLKLDKWGKKRLAYRVRKNKFGFYLNIYHTCEPGGVPDLEKEYRLYELIIKFMVIRLEDRDIERVMTKAADSAEPSDSEKNDSETPAAAGKKAADSAEPSDSEKNDSQKNDSETPAAAGKSD